MLFEISNDTYFNVRRNVNDYVNILLFYFGCIDISITICQYINIMLILYFLMHYPIMIWTMGLNCSDALNTHFCINWMAFSINFGWLYCIDCSISTGSFLFWIHFNIKCVFFLRNRIICSKLFRKHHSSCSFPATYLLSIFCCLKSPNLQSSLIFAAQDQLYIFFLQQSSIRCADNSSLFYSWPNNKDI